MGNPLQTIPNLPPAIGLSGAEQLWINQAGVDRRTTAAALALLAGGGGGGGGGLTVASYAALRASAFPVAPGISTPVIVLTDPYKGGLFLPAPPTAPPTALRDNGGTVIVDALGQAWWRVYSGPVNAGWFYGNPAPGSYLGDGLATKITAADQIANPQWIGLVPALGGGNYPVGTTWASVAVQEALYACFAQGSTPGHVVWNVSSSQLNLPLWLPHGNMPLNQPFYLSARGVDIEFAEKAGSQLLWQGAQNLSPVMFDAISYGRVSKLSVIDQVGVTGNLPLVDVNWTGANPGLKSQQLTFYDPLISGVNQGDSVGFYVSRHGGDAQGDTIVLITPSIFNVYTGLIAGGTNALNITLLGGDFQVNFKNGCVAFGGSFMLYSTSLQVAENDFRTYPRASQIALDGADAYIYPGAGATSRCALRDVRSENVVLCYDRNHAVRVDNCSVAQYYGATATWFAGAFNQIGTVMRTNGIINGIVMLVDDGGPAWFTADAASTNTRIIKQGSSPGWAPGQWVGFDRWFRFANGFCFAGGPITASDANSVTDPHGWYASEPFPGFVPGMLAGYLVKVGGITGTTQPVWDSYPPGLTLGLMVTPMYGLTTSAGSNVVSSLAAGVANGQYMVVCDALRVQAPPSSTTVVSGALIGKVQNYTVGAHFTASLTAGVMTVSAMTSGTIKIGACVTLQAGWPGTVVTGQTSGAPGGVGVYTVSNPQQPDVASALTQTLNAWELVGGQGEPQLATRAIADGTGYWGFGIPDGQVTWLPLDFDVLSGVPSGDNIVAGLYGKFRECGFLNLNANVGSTALTRFRPIPNGGPFPNFSYRNGSPLTQGLVNLITTTAITAPTLSQIAEGAHAEITNALAAFTLNMPIYLDNLTQEFRLFITNNNAAGVLTWGTNVKAASPTLALGGVGKMTIVTLTWIGTPTGAGSWYVGNAQGPM